MLFTGSRFGLDISDFSIEAMELKKSFNHYKIVAYSRIKLEAGIVDNGVILKMPKLVAHIKELLENAKPHKIKPRIVSLSLPESKVFVSIISLPSVLKTEQIQEAVNNQIPEIFPLGMEEAVSAWKILDTNEKEQELLVAAVEQKLFSQYLELAEHINAKVISLEMESISTARAVMPMLASGEGYLLIDLGARTTNISVFDHHGLYSTYNINIAGNKFTEAIAKKLKISEIEAEKKKIASGLNPAKDEGKVLLIIQSLLQELITEVRKSINYFEDKTKKSIKQGYLSGGSSLLPAISDYLGSNLEMKIELGDPFTKITNSDKIISKKQGVLFANVAGLAMRALDKKTENSINFINNR